jgi:nucleoside 2-deoxyribosyltransferase
MRHDLRKYGEDMEQSPPLNKHSIPRVYLAGKMGTKNFRDTLGLGYRDMACLNKIHTHKGREYIYSGPIVPSCDHGCWHLFFEGFPGFDSGYVEEGEDHFFIEQSSPEAIVGATISQIRACDFLFAWFDSYDAFGSIAEVGIAVGMGIPVYVGFRDDVFPQEEGIPEDLSWNNIKGCFVGRELWYLASLAHQSFVSHEASTAFSRALRSFKLGKKHPSWKPLIDASNAIFFPGDKS